MPVKPTLYSRISTGYWNSDKSLAGVDAADTGADFSCINGAAQGTWAQTGAFTGASTFSNAGAATFQSTVSARGQVNADAGIQVGGGLNLQIMSMGTAALSLGAINPLESSSVVTFAVSGLSRGDFLGFSIDANYPNAAANRDVTIMVSSSSTVGEAHAWGVNSTLTAVTPTAATYVRWLRIKGGNWPAA